MRWLMQMHASRLYVVGMRNEWELYFNISLRMRFIKEQRTHTMLRIHRQFYISSQKLSWEKYGESLECSIKIDLTINHITIIWFPLTNTWIIIDRFRISILAFWLIFNSFVRGINFYFKLITSRHLRHLAKCFPDEPTGSIQDKKPSFLTFFFIQREVQDRWKEKKRRI